MKLFIISTFIFSGLSLFQGTTATATLVTNDTPFVWVFQLFSTQRCLTWLVSATRVISQNSCYSTGFVTTVWKVSNLNHLLTSSRGKQAFQIEVSTLDFRYHEKRHLFYVNCTAETFNFSFFSLDLVLIKQTTGRTTCVLVVLATEWIANYRVALGGTVETFVSPLT